MSVLTRYLCSIVVEIINPLILLLSAGALIAFLWGVFQFIAHGGDETKRAEGREAIIWGLVGLVIIFGAYGIINLTVGTFGLPFVEKVCSAK